MGENERKREKRSPKRLRAAPKGILGEFYVKKSPKPSQWVRRMRKKIEKFSQTPKNKSSINEKSKFSINLKLIAIEKSKASQKTSMKQNFYIKNPTQTL